MAGKRRNLALRLEASESPYSPQLSGQGTSPMTALSNSMVGLSCVGFTPRRKLSLSEGGDTPTVPLSRNSSQSSGISVSSPDPEDQLEGDTLSASLGSSDSENVRRTKQALRRFNSNPTSFDSPLFSQPPQSTLIAAAVYEPKRPFCLESPSEEEEVVFFSAQEKSENESSDHQALTSQDSDSSGQFTSIRPLPQDESSRPRPISAPANLLNQGKLSSKLIEEEVQLQHSRLTSSNEDEEEEDDGFCELFDSDSQGSSSRTPQGLKKLLHDPIIPSRVPLIEETLSSPPSMPLQAMDCNAMDITPEPKCRRGIFKVPSQPVIKRSNSFLKRPERPKDTPSPIMKKKHRSMSVTSPNPQQDAKRISKDQNKKCLGRSLSMADIEKCKKRIDQKLSQDAKGLNFTGDGSMSHLLPLINGCHKDLKTITPETLAKLIQKGFCDEVEEFFIVDARYPYEFKGGHIKGAVNLFSQNHIDKFFLKHPMQECLNKRRLVIFHCEFSSQRAPRLLKYLREEDRNANLENYPALFYPELYILDGGYKNFFEQCKVLCEPQSYKPMLHKDHASDLKHFKAKSKSWSGGSRLKLKDRFT